jgi:hypothetical protein
MADAGGTQMARFLGGNRKLVLSHDWQDEDWLDPGSPRDGTLPGPGYTSYFLTVSPIDEIDVFEEKKALQVFNFDGGGDLNGKEVPPQVEEAFEKWYRELAQAPAQAGMTIGYTGSLESEDAVDRILDMIRCAGPHLPVLIDELDKGVAERIRGSKEARIKGLSIRMHRGGEAVPIAFVEHADGWTTHGLVKTQPEDHPEDEVKIIWVLGVMRYEGAELKVSDDGNSWQAEGA